MAPRREEGRRGAVGQLISGGVEGGSAESKGGGFGWKSRCKGGVDPRDSLSWNSFLLPHSPHDPAELSAASLRWDYHCEASYSKLRPICRNPSMIPCRRIVTRSLTSSKTRVFRISNFKNPKFQAIHKSSTHIICNQAIMIEDTLQYRLLFQFIFLKEYLALKKGLFDTILAVEVIQTALTVPFWVER